jgi:hypothetical protein
MAAENTLVYDRAEPRRPTLDDVDNAAFVNDPSFTPTPGVHPRAESYNQLSKLAVSAHQVVPVAKIWIRFNAGAPIVDQQAALRTNVVAYTLTDLGVGITRIAWPAGTFPAALRPGPEAHITADPGAGNVPAIVAFYGTNQVTVRTYVAGVPTDIAFVVSLQ